MTTVPADKPASANATRDESKAVRWFVLRDLKGPNAKKMHYQLLADKGFEVFTPMKRVQRKVRNKKVLVEVPAIRDMLFVHSSREKLDP